MSSCIGRATRARPLRQSRCRRCSCRPSTGRAATAGSRRRQRPPRRLRLRDDALRNEPRAPHLARRRMRLDLLVQQRLRVCRARRLRCGRAAGTRRGPRESRVRISCGTRRRCASRSRTPRRRRRSRGSPASRIPSRGRSRSGSSGRRSGSVVKPTWLFTITCSVPPTRYARSRARLNVSATTPSPGNAASPWMQTGTTDASSRTAGASGLTLMRARVPLSTGFTISR